jgi:hypothetical protein
MEKQKKKTCKIHSKAEMRNQIVDYTTTAARLSLPS